MPALRYVNAEGKLTLVLLDLQPDGDGKTPPLTLGAADDSESHICLSGSGLDATQARILGSGVGRDYAFVLAGRRVQVGSAPIEGIRVLRHGDCIRIADSELLYLDFVIHTLNSSSKLIGRQCGLPGCEYGRKPLEAGKGVRSQVVTCPWCGSLYHASCWLKLSFCGEKGCYPIRRMLLRELAAKIKPQRMSEAPHPREQKCWAGCSLPLEPGQEMIRCSETCQARYHVGCWLAMRDLCRDCQMDIPAVIDHVVFRTDERHGKWPTT